MVREDHKRKSSLHHMITQSPPEARVETVPVESGGGRSAWFNVEGVSSAESVISTRQAERRVTALPRERKKNKSLIDDVTITIMTSSQSLRSEVSNPPPVFTPSGRMMYVLTSLSAVGLFNLQQCIMVHQTVVFDELL